MQGKYQPIDVFEELSKEVGNLFRGLGEVATGSGAREGSWSPAVDIREEKDKFVVEVDLPGISPKDVEVTYENGVLLVKGEKVRAEAEKGESYYRSERKYGSFVRRFSLPELIDDEKITASGNNGVLSISLPKKEKGQAKRIKVS